MSSQGGWLLAAGLLAIAAATVWPFVYVPRALTWPEFVHSFRLAPSSPLDFPLNVLLFMPFGGGAALVLRARRVSRMSIWALTFLASVVASAAVESFQVWQPQRTPNVSDLVANALGGVAGAGLVLAWERRHALAARFAAQLTVRRLGIVYAGYLALALGSAFGLMSGFRPGGWDPGCRLGLGNEISGNRPWRGIIRDLIVLDRVVTRAEAAALLAGHVPDHLGGAVVAAYALDGVQGLWEAQGRSADLAPQTEQPPDVRAEGLTLDAGSWVATELPADLIATRINRSRQVTVTMTVRSGGTEQEGPARIFTLSRDPYFRNLTVSQTGTALSLRWRSPLTGSNGTSPELLFPEIFNNSSDPQRLVLSVALGEATLHRLGEAEGRRVSLSPEIGLVAALLDESDYWAIDAGSPRWWPMLLWSAVVFLPLGGILGGMLRRSGHRKRPGFALAAMVLALSVLAVEGIVFFAGGRLPRPGMVAIGLAMGLLALVAGADLRRVATARRVSEHLTD